MTEVATETTATATAAGATKETAATTDTARTILESASLVKPDGTFVEKWHENELLPQDLRGHKSLEVIKTLPDLVKRTINAEQMIGKNKIAVPNEKSKPEEWAAYYDAGGRPKTPGDYQIEIPTDMKSLYPDERVAELRKFAHAEGFSQKQVQAYLKYDLAAAAQMLAEQEQLEQRERDETVLALKKEFGAAYDERVHVGKRLVAEVFGGNEEGRLNFLQKFGDDPDFVRFAAAAGVKLVEHKALIAQLTEHTPSEALAKIKELEATPGYLNPGSGMTKEQRETITAQIREQYKIAYPEPAARKSA